MMIAVKTEPMDKNFQLRMIYSWNFRSRSCHNVVAQPSCFSHEIIKVQCLVQGHSTARQAIWVLNSDPDSQYRACSSVSFNFRTIGRWELVQKYLTDTYHVETNIFLYLRSLSEEFVLDWVRASGHQELWVSILYFRMCLCIGLFFAVSNFKFTPFTIGQQLLAAMRLRLYSV